MVLKDLDNPYDMDNPYDASHFLNIFPEMN